MPKRLSDTRPNKGLLRFANRLAIRLFRARLGWVLGNRFLMLTHTGRKSGLLRRAVLEVVRHDEVDDVYLIASGWGENADWFRNIQKTPEVFIQVGHRRIEGTATRLPEEQAEGELRDYARRHPVAFRTLAGRMLDRPVHGSKEDFRLLGQTIPVVALRPRTDRRRAVPGNG